MRVSSTNPKHPIDPTQPNPKIGKPNISGRVVGWFFFNPNSLGRVSGYKFKTQSNSCVTPAHVDNFKWAEVKKSFSKVVMG